MRDIDREEVRKCEDGGGECLDDNWQVSLVFVLE